MPSTRSYTLRDGFAVVTLDQPDEKVNILKADFLKMLEETATRLAADTQVKGAVVISAKKGGFIAGADIEAISAVRDASQGTQLAREGQRILDLWSKLPFPVVAAVHGHCIGGGTEFALACSARICTADAHFSLPEVKLGIFPGFGGTQRLPRLVGLQAALDLILSGRTVRAAQARKIGLVEAVCDSGKDLLDEALEMARRLRDGDGPHSGRSAAQKVKTFVLEENPLGRALLFRQARAEVMKKTKGHYPAPLKALEVVRQGTTLSLDDGLELEVQEIGPLLASQICKNLVHVFSLSQRPKKEKALAAKAIEVRRAAVLGAGVMGSGIAHLLASKDIPVVLRDLEQEALEKALAQIGDLLKGKKKKRSAEDERRLSLVTATTQLWGVEEADLVIEAVAEKMDVKKAVLKEVSSSMSDGGIFATNTSALSVSELQQASERPENVGGLHFFNPVHRMPLVEVVRAEKSSERTVSTLMSLSLALGKIPLMVEDSPGFLVNRLLGIYLNEATLLAEEGVDWQSLDRLMEEFGFPMGPFRLIDEVGIDIAAEVAVTLGRAFPYIPAGVLFTRSDFEGMRGKKDGAGFYLYRKGQQRGANPQVQKRWGIDGRRRAGVRDRQRLLYLMVNEAGRALQEGVVAAPEDVDTGMVFGAGFPPFRGGVCRWADRTGLEEIREKLHQMSWGERERFVPCPYLQERERFYPVEEPQP